MVQHLCFKLLDYNGINKLDILSPLSQLDSTQLGNQRNIFDELKAIIYSKMEELVNSIFIFSGSLHLFIQYGV